MPAPTYIIQEYCNALFDALFHILPLGTELDKNDPTPSRATREQLPWDDDAVGLLNEHVEAEPFLVRISAAKKFRDRVEPRCAPGTGRNRDGTSRRCLPVQGQGGMTSPGAGSGPTEPSRVGHTRAMAHGSSSKEGGFIGFGIRY